MDHLHYEGMGLPPSLKYGELSQNRMRTFHKSQRDTMHRDITAKSNKNRRYGDLLEPMSRLTMDFHGRLIDSQGRIVDPSRYFDMDDHYMDNERFIYPQDVIRKPPQGTYGFAQGGNPFTSLGTNKVHKDGMYRGMRGGMQSNGHMHVGSMRNGPMIGGLQSAMRYVGDPFYANRHIGVRGPSVGVLSYYNDQEGRQRMYGSLSGGYGTHGYHAGSHTLPRRQSGCPGVPGRGINRRNLHPEEKNNMEST